MSNDVLNGSAQRVLKALVERIERLEEEKKAILADIKEIYGEAKAFGFTPKILRKVIRLRAMDRAARQEEEALIDLYMAALEGEDQPDEPDPAAQAPKPPPAPKHTPEEARAEGIRAARDGQPITANPYPARSKQRAAWDEGHCEWTGDDGMGTPKAWRPEGEAAAPAEASEDAGA